MEGRKERFHLTTHTTHMVKDHSDSERKNPLPPRHGLLFSISNMCSFVSTRQYSTYHSVWYIGCGAVAGRKPIEPIALNWAPCKLIGNMGVVPRSDFSYLRLPALIFTSVPRNNFKTIVQVKKKKIHSNHS